jgi:hypothetical protein
MKEKEKAVNWWNNLDMSTRNFLWFIYDQTKDIEHIYYIEHRNK